MLLKQGLLNGTVYIHQILSMMILKVRVNFYEQFICKIVISSINHLYYILHITCMLCTIHYIVETGQVRGMANNAKGKSIFVASFDSNIEANKGHNELLLDHKKSWDSTITGSISDKGESYRIILQRMVNLSSMIFCISKITVN